jgi:hypothetical protein
VNESMDLVCPWPGCTAPLPPKNPRSGYQPKWCPDHTGLHERTGRPADPDKMVTVTCEACGVEFTKYRKLYEQNKTKRFFCSAECRNKLGSKPRTGETRSCVECAAAFYVKPASDQVTCSVACGNKYKARNQVTKHCEECGVEMLLPPSLADRRFCSWACSGHEDTRTTMVCEHCGDHYVGRPQENRRFCSKPCFYAWQTENAEGHVNAFGYRLVSDGEGGYRPEHRIVMERILGRRLTRAETVHHLNADRLDNDPTNLALMISVHPAGAAIGDVIESLEKQLRELRRDKKKLEAAGAGTTMRQSHLYSPDDPAAPADLFTAIAQLEPDSEVDGEASAPLPA